MKICTIEGCERQRNARGLCGVHYYRLYWKVEHPKPKGSRTYTLDPDERLRFYGWTVTEKGCWVWNGPKKRGQFPYGEIKFDRKTIKVHRLAYETWVGPIPAGLLVRHKCDNPPCINPEHLELGTDADNFEDMRTRNRYPSSIERKAAKLTVDQVREIRHLRETTNMTQKEIGELFGIRDNTVSQILSRKYWTWVE